MSKSTAQLIAQADLDALLAAQHSDVFAILGMHKHPAKASLIVRVFLPAAEAVEVLSVVDGKKVATLSKLHPDGLFAGVMGRRRKPFAYRLRAQYQGQWHELEDPYRFPSLLHDDDVYLFGEGTQERVYQWMGAQPCQNEQVDGTSFVLWAPDASRVSVVGDFNQWDGRRHLMRKHIASGLWEIFIPGLTEPTVYKYELADRDGKTLPLKADPYAFAMQHPPATASITTGPNNYQWQDQEWMSQRAQTHHPYADPVSIYEVHLGSWRRSSERDNGYLSYRELAEQLIPYVLDLGFTHLQLMPISEYPFDGSWGYQPVGMYAPSSRFGSPDDFRYFVDQCHRNGLGVLLDWVPGHFPTDEHGLGKFDGSCLYEHEDPRRGFHPDWNTLIYNYGRAEVISFLLSNAIYWIDEFHLDGLRVDAVASMLYLDYSRKEGEWLPNKDGGRENYEAIAVLQAVNSRVYFERPGVMMVAEESTAWPGVSRPVDQGGLGFGFKWNMGWMNDTLRYMSRDPIHRKFHHNEMTFGLVYAFSENFMLPLSHDEVVHGKGSLIEKMPGDDWQKFANLRAYYGFMWTHPGKKLLFMGCEFAQRLEWNHDHSLDWHLLEQANHAGIQRLLSDLNKLYRELPALHQRDCQADGFAWLDADNHEQSILAYLRNGEEGANPVVVVTNLTSTPHHGYRVGVPEAGFYQERLNTDSAEYGGSNVGNNGGVQAHAEAWGDQPCHLSLTLPPLSTLVLVLQ